MGVPGWLRLSPAWGHLRCACLEGVLQSSALGNRERVAFNLALVAQAASGLARLFALKSRARSVRREAPHN